MGSQDRMGIPQKSTKSIYMCHSHGSIMGFRRNLICSQANRWWKWRKTQIHATVGGHFIEFSWIVEFSEQKITKQKSKWDHHLDLNKLNWKNMCFSKQTFAKGPKFFSPIFCSASIFVGSLSRLCCDPWTRSERRGEVRVCVQPEN